MRYLGAGSSSEVVHLYRPHIVLLPVRLRFPFAPQNAVHGQIDVVIVEPLSLARYALLL
jgi:hypothetical protein